MPDTDIRLFIAATLPPALIKHLQYLQLRVKNMSTKASLTKPDNLHCTLRFIGEVQSQDVAAIREAFLSLRDKSPLNEPDGLAVQLDRVGRFHSDPGALIRVDLDVPDRFRDFVRDLEDALVATGLKRDRRPWKPHITLARRVVSAMSPDDLCATLEQLLDKKAFPIEKIVLFRSEFTPRGMKYTPLEVL